MKEALKSEPSHRKSMPNNIVISELIPLLPTNMIPNSIQPRLLRSVSVPRLVWLRC